MWPAGGGQAAYALERSSAMTQCADRSTAAADDESAIDGTVLLVDMLELAGCLGWKVARAGLTMTDRRIPSRVLSE
jgi:hypothetical protein